MTDTRRYSTRETRRRIWQTLRTHLLPLLLALLILSLPMLAAAVLDGLGETRLIEAEAVRDEMFALTEAWPEGMPEAEQRRHIELSSRYAELDNDAELLPLIGDILSLAGHFLARPLLFGVNLVLICILRGGDFRWKDAHITFAEFRKGFKLQAYILVLMLIMMVPGVLLGGFSDMLGEGVPALALDILSLVVTLALTGIASLQFQLAPRLLADGDEGTAGELVARSREILDIRTLLPQLSILFPGLMMVLAAWALKHFALSLLLPRAVAFALGTLLYLPGYAYLITGSAAIYTTFRKE